MRPLVVVALAFLGLTCRDRDLTGPGLPQRASLAVAPSLALSSDAPTVRLERLRVVAMRLAGRSIALDTVVSFPEGDDPLSLELDLTVLAPSESFELRLLGIAGADTIYRGVDTVEVTADETKSPREIPLRYAGPDTLVSTVELDPRDTTVVEGEAFEMRATPRQSDGSALPAAAIKFVSRDAALLSMTADGAGVAHAVFPGVWVVATSANGRQDSTRVTAIPRVAAVALSPRGSAAVVGDTIFFTARTLDAGGNPLVGRPVAFTTPDAAIAQLAPLPSGTARLVALAPGTARLIATSAGIADTATVTISLAPVASVNIAPDSVDVTRGETVQLGATLRDARGTVLAGRAVTWSSATPAAASVDAAGLVTGLQADSVVTIVATSEGLAGTARVRVLRRPVARIDVTPAAATLTEGTAVTLRAVALDAAGQPNGDHPIVWSSLDPATLRVTALAGDPHAASAEGLKAGTAAARASAGGVSTDVIVTVDPIVVPPPPVARVTVAPTTASIVEGSSVALTARALDAAGAQVPGAVIAWSTSNQAVATVSTAGVVTGTGGGTATITAASGGQSAAATVTVRAAIAAIDAGADFSLTALGQTRQLAPVARDRFGAAIPGIAFAYSVVGTAASVSGSGLVTAQSVGQARVIAAAEGRSDTVLVAVSQVPASVTVTSAPDALLTAIGDTRTLSAVVRDAGGAVISNASVTFSSLNTQVVTVAGATATAVGAGSATVQARAGTVTGSVTLQVQQTVTSVEVTPAAPTLASLGETVTLAARALDRGRNVVAGATFSWSSNAPTAATVSATGVVTAVANGTAVVTARYSPTLAATATVTVRQVAATVSLAPTAATLHALGFQVPLAATVRDARGNAMTGAPVAWTSNAPGTASVSTTGLVTAVANGAASITATSGAASAAAAITVQQVAKSVVISTAPPTLRSLGETVGLAAAASDSNNRAMAGAVVRWRSLAPTVASVTDPGGVVTAVANGTTSMIAQVDAAADTLPVTVSQTATSVNLALDTLRLELNASATLAYAVSDARNNPVAGVTPTFVSRDPAVATVTAAGVVRVVGSGITRVVASVGQLRDSVVVIKVPADVPVDARLGRIDVLPATATLRVGDTLTFRAEYVDAAGTRTPISPAWASTHLGRLAVSSAGLATASDTGSARVTATKDALVGRATVTVLPAPVPTSLSLAPSALAGSAVSAVTTSASVDAYDQGAGITSAAVTLTSPSGAQSRSCTATAPSTGTRASGSWRCALTLPAGSETGTWRVTSVQLVGTVTRTLTQDALAARGLAAAVAVSP
ncbi:MAG: Ig-like domain-containing protein [Gemmatimonadaceae bacterium]